MGLMRLFSSSSRRRLARPAVVNGLRLFWIIVVLWGELGVYYWRVGSCNWPEDKLVTASERATRVMLISDAQVNPPDGVNDSTWLGQLVFGLSLKRSWRAARSLRPDIVIFLGDMLSHGKYVASATEYKEYYAKFQKTFANPSNATVYYIPGNNDVGMGISQALSTKKVRTNYFSTFGPFNYQATVRGHQFVFLDAPGLVDEDYQRSAAAVGFGEWKPISQGPVEFVQSMVIDEKPVILLTHIPLARPDTASCGPSREKGTIRRGVGHGYQNTFGKQTTSFLLKALYPKAIFSGDNRDYCDYTHIASTNERDASQEVREVTVKSFSMARNIRYPGFQLLSLTEPSALLTDTPSFADTPCALPNQRGIIDHVYIPLMVLTFVVLFFVNYTGHRKRKEPPASIFPSSSLSPERNSPMWPYNQRVSPVSPPGALPSALRTPNSMAEPCFRAQGTPLGSPIFHGEEEEDVMFPSQYANRSRVDDDAWSPDTGVGNGFFGESEAPISPFVLKKKARWMWSWTFVLRGRRRRITISPPEVSWSRMKEVMMLFQEGASGPGKRRGLVQSTFIDGFSVMFTTVAYWAFMAWMTTK